MSLNFNWRAAAFCLATVCLAWTAPAQEASEQEDDNAAAVNSQAADDDAATGTALSLADALHIVASYHADVLAQRQTAAAQQEGENLARAQLLPGVSFNISDNLEENGKPLQGNLALSQQVLHIPYLLQWHAEASNAEAAELTARATELDYQRQFLIAWLDRQVAADTLELIRVRQKTLTEQNERTQTLAQAGRVTETDVLLARAQLASVRAQWVQAQHDLQTASARLGLYVGQPVQSMQLVAFEHLQQALAPPAALAQWLPRIREDNLNLQAMEAQIDYTFGLIDASRGIIYPRVELRLGLEGERGEGGLDETIGLNLSQSIYSGGEVAATQRQQQAQLSALYYSQQSLWRQLQQQARQLHGQMQATQVQLSSLRESVVAVEAALAAEIVGYNNGVRIAADVLDAEEQVFTAQLNYRQAVYDYFKSAVNLHALATALDDDLMHHLTAAFTPTQ